MDPTEKLQKIVSILSDPFSDVSQLTEREKEAAKLGSYGFKLREIAVEMGISVSTAGDYISKVQKKTGLNKGELTRAFIEKIVEVLMSRQD